MYEQYPLTEYNNRNISDILIRTNLINNLANTGLTDNYTIDDVDTAESLSLNAYGSSKYSWIILSLNKMFNRQLDWPFNSNKLIDIILNKYNYSSVYIPEQNIDFIFSNVYKIKKNQNEYIVQKTNRDLNELILQNKILSSNLRKQNYIDLYDKDNNLIKGNVQIGRVVYEGTQSLHHFENSNGFILDNRNTENYLYYYINENVEQNIQNLIFSNMDYENKINNNKRNIIILKSEYVQQYVSLINTVLNSK